MEPSTGPGELAISAPGLPTYQPPALYPLKETGETFHRVEPLQVFFNDPAHDPGYALALDPWVPTYPLPAPSPQSGVQAATGALSEAELRAVLTEAGWPEHLHGEALAIIHCESRGRPDANNGIDKGLFQMNFSERATLRGSWFAYFGVDESLWADPVTNATVARWAYELSGWPKWSCAALVGLQ